MKDTPRKLAYASERGKSTHPGRVYYREGCTSPLSPYHGFTPAADRTRFSSSYSLGRLKKKVVPFPSMLLAPTCPLWRWISFFTMANPRPVDFSPPVGFALNR